MKESIRQKQLEDQAKLSSKEIFKGKVFSLRCDTLEFQDHPPQHWDLIIHPGAVAALPINSSNKLILIQQWRRAIGQIIYELPAGTLEQDEEPLTCMQRELQEEIGYRADTLISLGGFHSAPGFCTEYIHLFIARGLTPSIQPKDTNEGIDIIEMDLDKALTLIDSNQIQDLKTIAGILRYERWIKKNG